MSPKTEIDRAALVRRALVELVAENGFHGTSMAAVAQRAGVATGTAYVHYGSKDELLVAAYVEVKDELGRAALEAADPALPPETLFDRVWHAIHSHLAADPVRARFLVQVEASPLAHAAHQAAIDSGELLRSPVMQKLVKGLVDLPPMVLWDLGMGPAVRLAAGDDLLSDADLDSVVAACWRAVAGC